MGSVSSRLKYWGCSAMASAYLEVNLTDPEQPRSKTQEIHRFLRIRVLARLQAHPRCSLAYFEDTIEHPYRDFLVSVLRPCTVTQVSLFLSAPPSEDPQKMLPRTQFHGFYIPSQEKKACPASPVHSQTLLQYQQTFPE